MEEQNYNTEEQLESIQSIKERRGSFLTVLCVLSWISAGGTFLSSITSLISGKQGIQNQIIDIEEQLDTVDNSFMYDLLEMTKKQLYLTLENFYPIYLSSFILSALGIYSVYLMFNLKKQGFNLYVTYALIAPIVSYYFVYDIPYSVYGLVFSLVLSVAFILMYRKNLNLMTN
jgi:hypothetical protein